MRARPGVYLHSAPVTRHVPLDTACQNSHHALTPRAPRLVLPGCPHHVTHRGNGGRPVFAVPEARRFYRYWLREYAAKYGLRIWAYCLMTNHVHLIVVPDHETSLSNTIGRLDARQCRWLNEHEGSSGHVWGPRFRSVPMDEPHLWAATRYVELNPVRAGVVARAEDCNWSSAPAHALRTPDELLSADLPFAVPALGEPWRQWLAEGLEDAVAADIRRATETGVPLGSREPMLDMQRRLRTRDS